MIFFRNHRVGHGHFSANGPGFSPSAMYSSVNNLGRAGVKLLIFIAGILVLMGLLTLMSPVVVTCIFFVPATLCLYLAWKVFRATRPLDPDIPDVQVEVHEPDEYLF